MVTHILASILVHDNLVMCIAGTGHWSLVSSLISGPWDPAVLPVRRVCPVAGRDRKVPAVIISFLLSFCVCVHVCLCKGLLALWIDALRYQLSCVAAEAKGRC